MSSSGDFFSLSVSFDTEPITVTVSGELDMLTAPSLQGTLNGLIEDGGHPIELDLGEVTFIDARGARVVREAGARALHVGVSFAVRSASTSVRRTLDLTDATARVALDPMAPDELTTFPRSTIDLVDASLQVVASLADATVTGNAGVSITLERYGQPRTVASSTDRVVAVDQHQYATGQGPCLDAARHARSFYIESLAAETRWPAFVPLAMQHGIRSILSCPLTANNRPQGSLNVYADVEGVFGPPERELASLFAEQASHVLTVASRDADDEWNERFAEALSARRIIHQAQGVVMARNALTAEEALVHVMQMARGRRMTAFAYASQIVNAPPDQGRHEDNRSRA